jgi:hypothetical protein
VAGASLFDRALAVLFGKQQAGSDQDQALVAELTDMIVDTVEPKVRAHKRYRQKLEPCVRTTIAWLREVGRTPLASLVLARADWSADPCLNAFFASPDDIPAFLGRSKELRAFFEDPAHAGVTEAFALLGMRQEERKVLAPRFEHGMVHEEVQQTTVNFTGHRLVAPCETEQQVRLEVGRRIMLRLAQVALGRILEIDRQGLQKEQQKAYLSTRLRFLKLAQDGMQGVVDDPTHIPQQIAEVQAELDRAVKDYIEVKSTLVTLDGYMAQIEAVFGHPAEHVALTRSELHLDRMNVKLESGREESHQAVTLAQLRVGEQLKAVIAFVRCPRSELPPRQDLLAQAERFL